MTESLPAKYRYRPLIARDAVRVVALEPSMDTAAPLCCSIIQYTGSAELAKIDNARHYSTVSYSWGYQTSRVASAATLDPPSCTSRPMSRAFYVDSIPLIGEIYRQAKKVHVWLGEDDGDAAKLLTSLRLVALIPEQTKPQELASRVKQLFVNSFGDGYWSHLNRFLTKDWFSRRWILQEAALSRTCTVHLGCHSLEYSWLLSAFQRLHQLNIPERYALNMIVTLSGTQNTMLDLRWNFHRAKCCDPRDRIPALCGLIPSNGMAVVDYGNHWSEIYRQQAIHFACRKGITLMLHLFEFGPINTTSLGFPSWIPDWSRERRRDFPYLGWEKDMDIAYNEDRPRSSSSSFEGYVAKVSFPRPNSISVKNDGLQVCWSEKIAGNYGKVVGNVVKYDKTHLILSRWIDVENVLRPIHPTLSTEYKKTSAQGSKSASPSPLSILIAKMLTFHGMVSPVLSKTAVSLVEKSLRGISSGATTLSNDHLRLMIQVCQLLQRFCLFEAGWVCWGFGPLCLQRWDCLIPFRHPSINFEVMSMSENQSMYTMIATRRVPELNDFNRQPQSLMDKFCRRRPIMLDSNGNTAASIPPIRVKYLGPSICILQGREAYIPGRYTDPTNDYTFNPETDLKLERTSYEAAIKNPPRDNPPPYMVHIV